MRWTEVVYKPKENTGQLKMMHSKEIYKRDNYQCQSCRKRFSIQLLSCHHIAPRAEGGDNSPKNLVTLCKPCHDLIECDEVKSLSDILYYKKRQELLSEKEIADDQITEQILNSHRDNLDWHTWVYGGQKRNNRGR